MIRSLFTAATGMSAQQKNVDNIANNLANVNSQGFKKGRVIFEDLLYQELKAPGTTTGAGLLHPTGVQEGLGVNVVGIHKVFSQGSLQFTENQTDVTIMGDGFFRLTLPNGDIGYTRQGAFEIDADGNLVSPQGYILADNITIPDDILELNIGTNGEISAVVAGDADPVDLGQITLARFINPAGLMSIGENLYLETAASGGVMEGIPGDIGFGTTKQLFLEMSNVNIVDEMVSMITAQRAYEMNSKAIQTSDEMLQIANGLKR